MSEHPPGPDGSAGWPLDEGPTEEHPTIRHALATPLDGPAWAAGDGAGEADDEEWVSQTTHGVRVGAPLAVLLTIVLVAAGFWGGAELEKSHNGGGSASLLGSLASRFRSAGATGASGASGAGGTRFGGFGGSAAAATGTISVVDGDTLYVTTSTGLVKVTLSKSTTVTRNADASAVDLRPGDTVVVQGATGTTGSVNATSVTATAPGVSSGFAGFGRGGFGATSPTGTSTSTTTTPSLFGG